MPDQEHPAWQAALNANTASTDRLGDGVLALVGELRDQRAEQRSRARVHTAVICLIVLASATVVALVGVGNRHLSQTVTDCTTAGRGHKCYVRSQRQTAKAIDEIVVRTVTAICTGFHPRHPEDIAGCVASALKGSK